MILIETNQMAGFSNVLICDAMNNNENTFLRHMAFTRSKRPVFIWIMRCICGLQCSDYYMLWFMVDPHPEYIRGLIYVCVCVN